MRSPSERAVQFPSRLSVLFPIRSALLHCGLAVHRLWGVGTLTPLCGEGGSPRNEAGEGWKRERQTAPGTAQHPWQAKRSSWLCSSPGFSKSFLQLWPYKFRSLAPPAAQIMNGWPNIQVCILFCFISSYSLSVSLLN